MNDDYKKLFDSYKGSDYEVLLFCSDGIHLIKIDDYNTFVEDKLIYYGEEGINFKINLAITTYCVYVGDKYIDLILGTH